MMEPRWLKMRMLHYLFSSSEGKDVAHCLDLDLVASGKTREEATKRLTAIVKAHVELALDRGNYGSLATAAPKKYWELFFNGKPTPTHKHYISIRTPDILPSESQMSEVPVLEAAVAA